MTYTGRMAGRLLGPEAGTAGVGCGEVAWWDGGAEEKKLVLCRAGGVQDYLLDTSVPETNTF